MQEFNLCTAQFELCDRDLELIFMHWPGPPCTPLLPVALKEPVSQGAEGTAGEEGRGGQRRRRGVKKRARERERVSGKGQELEADTNHPKAAVVEQIIAA